MFQNSDGKYVQSAREVADGLDVGRNHLLLSMQLAGVLTTENLPAPRFDSSKYFICDYGDYDMLTTYFRPDGADLAGKCSDFYFDVKEKNGLNYYGMKDKILYNYDNKKRYQENFWSSGPDTTTSNESVHIQFEHRMTEADLNNMLRSI